MERITGREPGHEAGEGRVRGARGGLRAAARGERGVTMVEMMVAMFIFMAISAIFLTSIMQFLHTTTTDAIRTRSASEIATATQRLDRYVRYATAMEYDADAQKVTMITPGDGDKQRCVVLQYDEATWSNGTVSDYGKLVVKTKDAGASTWGQSVVLGSMMNHSSSGGVTSDESLFGTSVFSLDGTGKVLTFSPVTGSYSGGKAITSNVSTTFTARNVKSTNPTPDFSVCK
ncbi:prepilin-type N-terminal cleavage/methylation domain-containing protein [Bifidobacterium sp. 64T4]|nr:prepilin-type N-terminal cleavage/methylation domain-containing protein [Bifidobacterium pongonis]